MPENNYPTLAELQLEVYANSKAHGFWDVDLSDPDVRESKLALIHSELSEALECVRNGELELYYTDAEGERFKQGLTQDKPCGLPSEIADVVIRVLGFCEGYDLEERCKRPVVPRHAFFGFKAQPPTATKLCAFINLMHSRVATASAYGALSDLVRMCYWLAVEAGFDLDAAIEAKAAYNLTRPHKHGKAL